jgi:hypothetical protein
MNAARTLKKEIINKLERLNPEEQRSVLELMQSFQKKGTPGKDLLSFAGSIPKSDLEEIEKTIEQDCEKINSGKLKLKLSE